MKNAIERILKAEAEAKRIVADAEAQARVILENANAQRQTLVDEPTDRARQQAAELLARARLDAKAERQHILEDAARQATAFSSIAANAQPSFINEVVRRIAGLEA